MFKKATKEQSKLRLALFGVSGGGKTYSALRLATGLGGSIALIDTEHGTASKYADRFDFDVCNLDKATINNVLMCIEKAKGYDVLIIDSLTHAWLELLQEVEKVARAKFGGNTWSAWSEGTPKQMMLINAILDFPGHIIVTMRAETNWTTTTNDKGKVVPVRIGEAPKQGKSIEYEFDMLIQLSQDHTGLVLKDRTGKFQDQCFVIEESFGEQLNEWLKDGKPATKEQARQELHEVNAEMISQEFEEERLKQDPILTMTEEDMIADFKKRVSKILQPKQIKLFMKKNNISLEDAKGLRKFLYDKDLEFTMELFLEEVEE